MPEYLVRLRRAGHRLTKARRAVVACLQGRSEPQTAAAIHRDVEKHHVDLASVYRTVELLERLGLVMREPRGNRAAYALTDSHHHHIVCRSCQREACLPCAIDLPRPKGFFAIQHQVALTGVCAACATAA